MTIEKPFIYWIEHLKLRAHPEGGFYRETYRASESIDAAALPSAFGGSRNFSTAIYFMLGSNDISHFHRIKSDELWHFHAGGTLEIFVLNERGLEIHRLGANLEQGDQFQVTIPANHWFGAKVSAGSYVLSGCTVAPGFDFRDFEMADRQTLLDRFPEQRDIIEMLTK